MKYTKPHLSFQIQAERLIERGLVADKNQLIKYLQNVNYYRLSAYWYPFKQPDDNFQPGTTLEKVWQRYTFDRQLRLLVMDAIERVEVAIRTRVVFLLGQRAGAFAHLDINNFQNIHKQDHQRLIDDLQENASRSSEVFVAHFRNTYDGFPNLPLWVAAETMTFGQMFTLFKFSGKHLQSNIAREYGITGKVLNSWLHTLNYIRNLCAHHARLWNRELAIKPLLPDSRHDVRWHTPTTVGNNRIFTVLTLLYCFMKYIAPQSSWRNRLYDLFDRYPDIPLNVMGILPEWRDHPLWK